MKAALEPSAPVRCRSASRARRRCTGSDKAGYLFYPPNTYSEEATMPLIVSTDTHWHRDVPGSRWFRADLHVHTIDDHSGGNVKMPQGLNGDPAAEAVQVAYARAFLKGAVKAGVEVIGLTPHCVRSGEGDSTSGTWRIVEMWANEKDDDGIAFREKIYCVYPGFEPSLSEGARGIHFLFLFDPTIGRDCYIRAFQAVMGGATPWNGSTLRSSSLDAPTVFRALDNLRAEEHAEWNYLCFAPHAFNDKGLFALKSQILERFPSDRLTGIELGDNALPEDMLKAHDYVAAGMREHRLAFYHGSDSTTIPGIGSRAVLLKLACPTIESLRQAFLASDSRLRIIYERAADGRLVERSALPEPQPTSRPWLREFTVSGGPSFFGGISPDGATERSQTFRFSPDLTCIIGGRMSGKSTLLDGLRVWFGHPLPSEPDVAKDVRARAEQRFLCGTSKGTAQLEGAFNPLEDRSKQWPAHFFTQRELQKAAADQTGIRQILFGLLPGKGAQLAEQHTQLATDDSDLRSLVKELADLHSALVEDEQTYRRASDAKDALDRWNAVGASRLGTAQGDSARLKTLSESIGQGTRDITRVRKQVLSLEAPDLSSPELADAFSAGGAKDFAATRTNAVAALDTAAKQVAALSAAVKNAMQKSAELESSLKSEIEASLAKAGGSAQEVYQFDTISQAAADFETARSTLEETTTAYENKQTLFDQLETARAGRVTAHRALMDEVLEAVNKSHGGAIRVRRIPDGIDDQLDMWLRDLKEPGLTRWWNDRSERTTTPSPILLLGMLRAGALSVLGMSDRVATTFAEAMTEQRKLSLRSLRNADKYVIELRIGGSGEGYREMSELSGGQQVSILLSLLLQTEDAAPLVIDQPEDELDNAYLWDTVLPCLRELRGRRQIILATHNANIVVNGDADQVICLSADFTHGQVSEQGAIDHAGVRDAVLRTVDGGEDAFELRHAKYGF